MPSIALFNILITPPYSFGVIKDPCNEAIAFIYKDKGSEPSFKYLSIAFISKSPMPGVYPGMSGNICLFCSTSSLAYLAVLSNPITLGLPIASATSWNILYFAPITAAFSLNTCAAWLYIDDERAEVFISGAYFTIPSRYILLASCSAPCNAFLPIPDTNGNTPTVLK